MQFKIQPNKFKLVLPKGNRGASDRPPPRISAAVLRSLSADWGPSCRPAATDRASRCRCTARTSSPCRTASASSPLPRAHLLQFRVRVRARFGVRVRVKKETFAYCRDRRSRERSAPGRRNPRWRRPCRTSSSLLKVWILRRLPRSSSAAGRSPWCRRTPFYFFCSRVWNWGRFLFRLWIWTWTAGIDWATGWWVLWFEDEVY